MRQTYDGMVGRFGGMRGTRRAYALLFMAVPLSASVSIASTVLMQHQISPGYLVWCRCLITTIALSLLALARNPGSLRVRRRDLGAVVSYAALGIVGSQWLYLLSLSRIPVAVAILIDYTAPVWVTLWAALVQRRRTGWNLGAGLVLLGCGLAAVIPIGPAGAFDGWGIAAATGAACCYAGYFLLGEHHSERRDPFATAAWGFGIATVAVSLGAPWREVSWQQLGTSISVSSQRLVPEFSLAGATFGGNAFANHALPLWIWLAWLALCGTAAVAVLFLYAMRVVGASRTAVMATAEALVAAIFAWLLLGQPLTATQWLGITVAVIGIGCAQTHFGLPAAWAGIRRRMRAEHMVPIARHVQPLPARNWRVARQAMAARWAALWRPAAPAPRLGVPLVNLLPQR